MLRDRLLESALKLASPTSLLFLPEQGLRRDDNDEVLPTRHVRGVLLGRRAARDAGLRMPLNSRVTFFLGGVIWYTSTMPMCLNTVVAGAI